jgi:hypothetical protein
VALRAVCFKAGAAGMGVVDMELPRVTYESVDYCSSSCTLVEDRDSRCARSNFAFMTAFTFCRTVARPGKIPPQGE